MKDFEAKRVSIKTRISELVEEYMAIHQAESYQELNKILNREKEADNETIQGSRTN